MQFDKPLLLILEGEEMFDVLGSSGMSVATASEIQTLDSLPRFSDTRPKMHLVILGSDCLSITGLPSDF